MNESNNNNMNNIQNANLNYESSNNMNNNYNTNMNNNFNNQNENSKKFITTIIIVVVVILCGIGIGFGANALLNKKDDGEIQLCQIMAPKIDDYKKEKISYGQFFEQIKNDYDKYCKGNNSDLCVTVTDFYNDLENDIKFSELENCNKYNGYFNESQLKELCESTNNEKKTFLDSHINLLNSSCSNVN